MATYDRSYDSGMRSATDSRLTRHLRLDWSALFGGALIGWGAMLLLSMIGMILGLSVLDPFASRPAISNTAAAFWGGSCAVVCSFIGGYAVVRLAGDRRRSESLVHGAVAWAMSMLLAGCIALWASSAAAFSRTPVRSAATGRARATVSLIETTGNGSAVALIACCGALLALGTSLLGALAGSSRTAGIPLSLDLRFHRGLDGQGRMIPQPDVRREQTTIIPPHH